MRRQLEDSVRDAICEGYDAGECCTAIAQKMGIKYRTVASIVARYKKSGRAIAARGRRRRTAIAGRDIGSLGEEAMGRDASATLREVQGWIFELHGVKVPVSTL